MSKGYYILVFAVLVLPVVLSGCLDGNSIEEEPEMEGGEMPDRDDTSPNYTQINPHADVTEEMNAREDDEFMRLSRSGPDKLPEFDDEIRRSGIRFEHESVPDAGKENKPNHYDHGNGMAVADVTGNGYLDIYFTNQIGANELWLNNGDGTFSNGTRDETAMADRVSSGASFADVNNNGYPDLYVTSIRGGNELFINEEGRLVRRTEEAGVGYQGHSSSSFFFDYDGDGYLDLFVVNVGEFTTERYHDEGYFIGEGEDDEFGSFNNHRDPKKSESSILYRNIGGERFEQVTETAGLEDDSWSGDGTPVYYNGNKNPGVYLLNMQGDDSYYLNNGTSFVEDTQSTFGKTPWGAMGISQFDHNNDGDMSLYITDMHSDMHPSKVGDIPLEKQREKLSEEHRSFYDGWENNIFGNAFYDSSNGDFVERSDELNLENYWPWGVSAGDLNANGYPDMYVTASMNYGFKYVPSYLLLNDGGEEFYHAEFSTGIEPREELYTSWFRLDCSGEDTSHRHCSQHDGNVEVLAPKGSRSSVIFDADGDGTLDIVTNEFNSEPRYLVNDISDIRYIKVELEGTESNRDGLGARVTVETGSDEYSKYNHGQSGYLSQSSKPLYFGLGESPEVEEITVDWPSGEKTRHEVNQTNTKVILTEDGIVRGDTY